MINMDDFINAWIQETGTLPSTLDIMMFNEVMASAEIDKDPRMQTHSASKATTMEDENE